MPCRVCQSEKQSVFPTELNIDFPGRENLEKSVLAFPETLVCLDCGFTEFVLDKGRTWEAQGRGRFQAPRNGNS
jgi:hypothetical protein